MPASVQIIAWRRPGNKPLTEPMMVRLPTHISATRPQWVKAKSRKSKTCDWPFVRRIQRWPVDSPHKESVTANTFQSNDVCIVCIVTGVGKLLYGYMAAKTKAKSCNTKANTMHYCDVTEPPRRLKSPGTGTWLLFSTAYSGYHLKIIAILLWSDSTSDWWISPNQ